MSKHSESPIEKLKQVMIRLRHPTEGCPWDREQTFATVVPYTIEEAYEVEDAIHRGDLEGIREELGDLLLHIVFHSRIAEESGYFDFDSVAESITDKMIARHPHVFGDEKQRTRDRQSEAWENQKTLERNAKAVRGGSAASGALKDIAITLPALMRAGKLVKRAGQAGYDPTTADSLLDKLEELTAGAQNWTDNKNYPQHARESFIGELLFAAAHLARHLNVDAEKSLRETNHKFVKRFHQIESRHEKEKRLPGPLSMEEWNKL